MNDAAKNVFIAYFGEPSNVFLVMLVMVLVPLGITLMIIATRAIKERRERRGTDDTDVFVVLLRGLALMLLVTALFAV